jgi:hypothetical protein
MPSPKDLPYTKCVPQLYYRLILGLHFQNALALGLYLRVDDMQQILCHVWKVSNAYTRPSELILPILALDTSNG